MKKALLQTLSLSALLTFGCVEANAKTYAFCTPCHINKPGPRSPVDKELRNPKCNANEYVYKHATSATAPKSSRVFAGECYKTQAACQVDHGKNCGAPLQE